MTGHNCIKQIRDAPTILPIEAEGGTIKTLNVHQWNIYHYRVSELVCVMYVCGSSLCSDHPSCVAQVVKEVLSLAELYFLIAAHLVCHITFNSSHQILMRKIKHCSWRPSQTCTQCHNPKVKRCVYVCVEGILHSPLLCYWEQQLIFSKRNKWLPFMWMYKGRLLLSRMLSRWGENYFFTVHLSCWDSRWIIK